MKRDNAIAMLDQQYTMLKYVIDYPADKQIKVSEVNPGEIESEKITQKETEHEQDDKTPLHMGSRTANVYKRFPRLEERRNQMAGTLSGGEQQMLAMGRALMSKPKIILMDEPSMGLSPIFVNEIFDIIQAVSESGTTVLLVEQNAKKALSIADRAYVLETGKITMSGNAKDLLEDEAVKKAYLGE